MFDTVGGDRAQTLFDIDQSVMDTGEPVLRTELTITSNGEERIYQSSKVPLRDGNGNVVGLVVLDHDATEQKQAEAELLEAKRRPSRRRVPRASSWPT